jgi:hypothetical protein
VAATFSATLSYFGDILIMQNWFETSDGAVDVIDFMTRIECVSNLARLVRGIRSKVEMHTDLFVRFGYGAVKRRLKHAHAKIYCLSNKSENSHGRLVLNRGRQLPVLIRSNKQWTTGR